MSSGAMLVIAIYAGVLLALWQFGRRSGWKTWVRWIFLVALVPGGVGLAISAGLSLEGGTPEKKQLLALADRLKTADKKGDVAAANQMLDESTALLRALNPDGTSKKDDRNCLLAAVHLSDGVVAVSKGGAWLSRDRFDTAVGDCK